MMDHYWNTHWGMGWGSWFLFLLLCAGIYFLYRNNTRTPGYTREETPLEILKKRYARGEITKEQFEEIRKGLE